MSFAAITDCICCCFEPNLEVILKAPANKAEVFFAKTRDLDSWYSNLRNYITNDEQLRADKFLFEEDMKTYVSCHALLRLILSERLNKNPLELSFVKGIYNKPVLTGNPLSFNITHTREAFAIAVSKQSYIGIDLAKIDKKVDIDSITKTHFSNKECAYIQESKAETLVRFFLLWTRKEAILKAIGTGIVDELVLVEVSEDKNFINKNAFNNLVLNFDTISDFHFIYSKKLFNHYLSIALPQKAEIIFYQFNAKNLKKYIPIYQHFERSI